MPAEATSTIPGPPDRPAPDPLVQSFLAERDVPCPQCGYNLRGSGGAACPECGRPLRLTIDGAQRRSRAFYLGLVGLATAAACHGFCVIGGLFHYSPTAPLLFGAVGLAITWLMFRSWTARADEIDRLLRHKQQEQVSLPWLWALLNLMVVASIFAD